MQTNDLTEQQAKVISKASKELKKKAANGTLTKEDADRIIAKACRAVKEENKLTVLTPAIDISLHKQIVFTDEEKSLDNAYYDVVFNNTVYYKLEVKNGDRDKANKYIQGAADMWTTSGIYDNYHITNNLTLIEITDENQEFIQGKPMIINYSGDSSGGRSNAVISGYYVNIYEYSTSSKQQSDEEMIYTVAHELGHTIYGIYDAYAENGKWLEDPTAPSNSIMNNYYVSGSDTSITGNDLYIAITVYPSMKKQAITGHL